MLKENSIINREWGKHVCSKRKRNTSSVRRAAHRKIIINFSKEPYNERRSINVRIGIYY